MNNIPKGATHTDSAGNFYWAQAPGHEDGTIGLWTHQNEVAGRIVHEEEGRWITSETSGAFEATLTPIANENVVHDFDPSGDEHPPACMCPCCDLAEDEMDEE